MIRRFWDLYAETPKAATDDYYAFSKTTNYIRADRLAKDASDHPTPYGDMDITINLSKPEKDPKAIAAALQMKQSAYPKCQLCGEGERGLRRAGQSPARQNHRIIPLEMGGGPWFLQYSPYGYYNEHCIVFNGRHTPIKIDNNAIPKAV